MPTRRIIESWLPRSTPFLPIIASLAKRDGRVMTQIRLLAILTSSPYPADCSVLVALLRVCLVVCRLTLTDAVDYRAVMDFDNGRPQLPLGDPAAWNMEGVRCNSAFECRSLSAYSSLAATRRRMPRSTRAGSRIMRRCRRSSRVLIRDQLSGATGILALAGWGKRASTS